MESQSGPASQHISVRDVLIQEITSSYEAEKGDLPSTCVVCRFLTEQHYPYDNPSSLARRRGTLSLKNPRKPSV